MRKLTFSNFDRVYQSKVEKIMSFWTPTMQMEISRHCCDWNPQKFNFAFYLKRSSLRFYYAYLAISDRSIRKICDIGGFWGVFPLTLVELGFEVTMTECLDYYSESFSKLFEYIGKSGVRILDFDPFEITKEPLEQYDMVTCMAVIEHYPHSLKAFVGNISKMVKNNGYVYIEVPNIAYWPKRRELFLRGKSPLASITSIYFSESPFIGHHHEYTITELRELASYADMMIIEELFYNYSDERSLLQKITHSPFETIVYYFIPDSRECISILLQRKSMV